ncbi:MAG: hypothetical protein A3K09_05225 [Nitrospinae bacterium RIFCSPLOWO2_12_FULL_47_7]|nr:MAG: hypothetical protein A3K09_05225 [Nitrospinae bacterium RIFCSPLOWO2_12_FULL_47_7]
MGFMEAAPPAPLSFIQSFYMGLFAVFFLCAGFFYLKHRAIRFWFFLFLIGIFFSLGKHNPLYQGIYEWFPLVKLFRYPEKYYFLSAYSQVFLVGYGVDFLIKSIHEAKSAVYLWLIPVLGLGLVVLGMSHASFSCLLVLGVSILLFSWKLNAGGLKSILLILIVFDLILKHYMLVPMIDKNFYETAPRVAREIKEDKELSRIYVGKVEGLPDALPVPNTLLARQLYIKEILYQDFGAIHGMSYADGGRGWSLESRDQWLWTEIFYRSPPEKRLRMLKRSNVKYWIEGEEETEGMSIRTNVRKFDDVLPRAFLVGRSRADKDPQLLNTYYDESFDPRREVLLSEPVAVKEAAGFDGVVENIQYGPNQALIQTRQNGEGFLVLLDAWFPGWTVTVDGVPQHIFRANHFYRAVQLSSGSHKIEFLFEPVGFWQGLWVSAITLTIMLAMYLSRHTGKRWMKES